MELNLEGYNFDLPQNLIAKVPSVPRDGAKLLIYDRKQDCIRYDHFLNLNKYLPKNSVLVFNKTKVLPARMYLKKETGGEAEVLFLRKEGNNAIKVLADRKLAPNSFLFFKSERVFKIIGQDKNIYYLKPIGINVFEFFEKNGNMPIPPYIKNTPLPEGKLREKYQTVFAKEMGSAAAPTASLHFTKRLIKKLEKEFAVKYLTLHVGLGTFAPLTAENLKSRKLHREYYEIEPKTFSFLKNAKKKGRPIIAVGTTVARALESGSLRGETDLFITPGYKFKMIDGLVTNFHLPKSSLLMLVSAFMERENALKCYNNAIKRKLKFYSFGDGMLIL